MYPRAPLEPVDDPLGSAGHTLGTTVLDNSDYILMKITAK